MAWLDVGLIVILAAFAAHGVWRGLVRQLIAIASLLAALLVAGIYHRRVAGWLATVPSIAPMAAPAAYAMLLVGVWSLVNLTGVVLYGEAQRDEDDRWMDDLAGGLLGLIKGALLLSTLVLGAASLGFASGLRAANSPVMRWLFHLAETIARITLPQAAP